MGKKSKRVRQPQVDPKKKTENNEEISDLFDNPMTKAAMSVLTEEQLADYKAWGEHLFGHIDFEDAKALKKIPAPVEDSISYIVTGLKSGINPEDLEPEEIELMNSIFGENVWKERYSIYHNSQKKT
jgi:hypothetical protein